MLYDISEKIRYEVLGTKMLNGISKNLKDNYSHEILIKKKDNLNSKNDVSIEEAFKLYMLKNFLGIKLDPISEKILGYWEKDFKKSFNSHIQYLSQNLEDQESYNSKVVQLKSILKVILLCSI